MAEWDIETITLRAGRDYADQFHFQRGAGDDAAEYEADRERAKAEIAAALAEHDREVAEREWEAGVQAAKSAILRHESVTGWQGVRLAELVESLINPHREPDDAATGGAS